MRGTVISNCKTFDFDEGLEKFDLNLPQPSKKDNVVHVLLPNDYPYRPAEGDTVQITGTLITYDESEAGLQTYILVISLFKCGMDGFDPEENRINVIGRVFKMDKLCKTAAGIAVQRISISVNTRSKYKPVHCIGYQNFAESLSALNKKDMVELSGRLISRKFLYREDRERETTELIVDYIFPLHQALTELKDPAAQGEDAKLMSGQPA